MNLIIYQIILKMDSKHNNKMSRKQEIARDATEVGSLAW